MATQWEYRILLAPDGGGVIREEIEATPIIAMALPEALEKAGDDGWELVALDDRTTRNGMVRVIFKRPKP
jgi:hypothetical protein